MKIHGKEYPDLDEETDEQTKFEILSDLVKRGVTPGKIFNQKIGKFLADFKKDHFKCRGCNNIVHKSDLLHLYFKFCKNCEHQYKKHLEYLDAKRKKFYSENSFNKRGKEASNWKPYFTIKGKKYNKIFPETPEDKKIEILYNLFHDKVINAAILDDYTRNEFIKFKEKYGLCENCKTLVTRDKLLPYYAMFCHNCEGAQIEHSNLRNQKMIETNNEKYGVDFVTALDSVKEKSINTNLKKYGVANTGQSKEVRKKIESTCAARYGFKTNLMNPEQKQKIKNTCFEKYNASNPAKNPEISKKISNSLSETYKNEKIKKEIRQKHIDTMRERYGVDNSLHKHIKHYENWDNEKFIRNNFIKNNTFLHTEFCDYFGVSYVTALNAKERMGITEPNKLERLKTQNFILENICSDNIKSNYRELGIELDIYLPNIKLAVEYNGLMFHSQGAKTYSMFPGPDFDKNYHLNKTELCNQNGIQLFHIFEGENLDLWLSMINNKLNKSKRIFARSCIIKELTNKETKEFLNENHIQGYCAAKINLGLFYNNELVQVMTFSKPRFNKNYEYELIRLCSLKNTTVVGGPSKLLNYFKKEYKPKSIISYANRRFSNGSIYEKLGFKLINKTNPNYFYFKNNKKNLESRNKYQKHKLKNLLENFDPNLTESENMFNNGFRRIFDCGNLVYELMI